MQKSSIQHKPISAALLARSVGNLFPQSKIIRYGQTKRGFYCLCRFNHPFDDQALRMTEEEFRRTVQEDLQIEPVEMMRENAAVFFEHHNQELIGEEIRGKRSNIIELVRIGEFYGLCPKPSQTGTKQIGAVKLFWENEGEFVKIEGVARETSKELKQFLKKLEAFVPHEELGRQANLFSIENNGCFWAPKGELIRENLLQWWKFNHRKLGFSIVSSSGSFDSASPRFEYGHQLAEISEKERDQEEIFEGGLFDMPLTTSDRIWWALDEQSAVNSVNSYLHFIKKTVNMIPIDCTWIFYNQLVKSGRSQKNRDLSVEILSQSLKECGIEVFSKEVSTQKYPAIEARFKDTLEREWPGPRIELREACDLKINRPIAQYVLVGSVFRSMESLIAILLESTFGELPFWLAPEQIRILPVKQEDVARVKEIVDELTESGYRATCDVDSGSLSEKVYIANQLKVPYVVVVGKKEREKHAVSVKYSAKGNETSVISFELFKEELRKQNEKAQFPY